MPTILSVGDSVPLTLSLSNQKGDKVSLSQLLQSCQQLILYFYPKDDTTGCTTEACEIRDNWQQFKALEIPIYGVSPDNAKKHQQFINKHSLPFDLLCDEEHRLAEAFGVWGEKKMYGRTYMGILRSSFIIRNTGEITAVFTNVKPKGHAQQLLLAIES